MTARYRIHHTSSYSYDQTVTASFNEVRQTPAATLWQSPLESVLRVDQSSWHHRYVDYWGTQVRVFEAHTPHRELVVDMTSLVEVDASRRPGAVSGFSWTDAHAAEVADRFSEFLAVSTFTAPPPELAEISESLAGTHSPVDAVHAIAGAVYDTMTYVPGSTGVHTLAGEAWDRRTGVCQDYAHLVVGALRHVGVPTRYASGYLHPKAQPEVGVPVTAQSHAWVQWWLGEWIDHDPTNRADVVERHVLVGTGRDYGDVPPIKGIVAGTPVTTDLDVAVTITRQA